MRRRALHPRIVRSHAPRALVLLALAACAETTAPAAGPFGAQPSVAEQRLAFAVESVCVQNRTPAAQRAAAERLDFPGVSRRGGETSYLNPATGTILVIGPVPEQSVTLPDGTRRITPAGAGCWAGSPAVPVATANRIASRFIASRLVEANALTSAPIAAGENETGGIGLFFERITVTVPEVTTVFDGPDVEPLTVTYPSILVRHS